MHTPHFCLTLIQYIMANNSIIPIDTIGLSDFEMSDGEENMAGMTERIYLALKSHISEWPKLKDDPQSLEDLVTTEGDFVMKEDKFFIKLDILRHSGGVTPENQGEDKGHSFLNKLEFKLRGATKAQAAGLARLLNNSSGVVLAIDNDGNRIQIGDEDHPAYFKPTADTGKTPTDRSEWTYSVEADNFCPTIHYVGAIPLDGAESVPPLS